MLLLLLLLFAIIPSLLASVAALSLFLYITLYRASTTTRRTSLGRSAAVVVLGDVGRSPRMCYHVESLADEGWRVAVIGYGGSALPTSIQRSSVRFHVLKGVPSWVGKLPRTAFIAVAPFKLLWQSIGLFWKITMSIQPPPEVIFVQTPPALPTLLVIKVCSMLLSSRVIIDWHNLGYTILGLRLGAASPIVTFARVLERLSGRTAFAHLFVTHAMKRHLEAQWQLEGHKVVLHDRPPKHFRKARVSEMHQLWRSLAPRLAPQLENFWPPVQGPVGTSTPFTMHDSSSGKVALRDDRPALVVSSTSWTADEDFGLLLRAAQLYEKRAQEIHSRTHVAAKLAGSSFDPARPSDSPRASQDLQHAQTSISKSTSTLEVRRPLGPPSEDGEHTGGTSSSSRASHRSRRPSWQSQRSFTLPNTPAMRLPKLLIVVTGKGELRSYYEKKIARLERSEAWEFVRIRTVWLENWEYPVLLGSADLGVSLHTSSSGLDLPMKVVDMLGCRLPVLALDFPCLDELIQHGYNGLRFSDEEQLVEGWESLLADFPHTTADTEGNSGETASNWLVKGGGLEEPFALAGRSSENEHTSLARNRSDPSALASAGEGMSDHKRLSFPVLDFSKGGLPTSSTFASQPLSSPTSAETYDGRLMSRPMTPTPSFTMVPSPILGSFPLDSIRAESSPMGNLFNGQRHGHRQEHKGSATWASNWKATVRPLLRLADEEDAKAEGDSLSDEDVDEFTLAGDSYDNSHGPGREQRRLLRENSVGSQPDRFSSSSSAPALYCAKGPSVITPRKRRRRMGSNGRPLRVRGGSVHGLLWGSDYPGSPPMMQGSSAGIFNDGGSDHEIGSAGAEEQDGNEEALVGLLGTINPRSLITSSPVKSKSIGRRLGLTFTPLKHTGKKDKKEEEEEEEEQPIDTRRDNGSAVHSPCAATATATNGGSGLGLHFGTSDTPSTATTNAAATTGEMSSMPGMQQHLRHRTATRIHPHGSSSAAGTSTRQLSGDIPDICVSEVESTAAAAAAGGGGGLHRR